MITSSVMLYDFVKCYVILLCQVICYVNTPRSHIILSRTISVWTKHPLYDICLPLAQLPRVLYEPKWIRPIGLNIYTYTDFYYLTKKLTKKIANPSSLSPSLMINDSFLVEDPFPRFGSPPLPLYISRSRVTDLTFNA
ncbi:hypothetical protein HanXRQr2_Chr13g0613591 [Helianthus annuus]|uniref:Uncharacterized protein n=1 Tax=Helianthus annuus TaxID=4232 RepID=A0A9K3EM95_HELAN|nr:hypothetical protein HanXRQr2_Chr13g0613591 [Helianthus annuus]